MVPRCAGRGHLGLAGGTDDIHFILVVTMGDPFALVVFGVYIVESLDGIRVQHVCIGRTKEALVVSLERMILSSFQTCLREYGLKVGVSHTHG